MPPLPGEPASTVTPPTNPTQTSEPSLIGGAGAEPPAGDPPPQDPPAGDPPANEPPAPLEWADDLVPEGVTLDEDTRTEFLGILNNAELDRKGLAQNLLSLHARMMESVATEMVTEWEKTQAEWREQVAAMPEFQGRPREEPLGEIARIVNRYGGPEARKAFDLTGAGNHPAVVRMLLAIAKDINEEGPVLGAQPPPSERSREERLYGNSGG